MQYTVRSFIIGMHAALVRPFGTRTGRLSDGRCMVLRRGYRGPSRLACVHPRAPLPRGPPPTRATVRTVRMLRGPRLVVLERLVEAWGAAPW